MSITFTPQDYITYQVKQVLRENQPAYENKIFNNCSQRIEDKYLPEFDRKIANARNSISAKDTLNILHTLKDAYKNAGRVSDSQVLEQQIQKLNIEG